MNSELARLIAGFICVHLVLAGTRMAAPLLALTLGCSTAQVGMLLACFALPQVLLALPAGRWSDRRGVREPVRASVAVATAGVALAAAWPIYPVLCVTACFAGASAAVAAIAIQRQVGRLVRTPSEMKSAFSWVSMAPALSNFLGPMAAGLLIDHAGYRVAFLALAVMPTIGWVCVRRSHEPAGERPASRARGAAWELWQAPPFRRLLLLNWLTSASFDVHGFVVPVLGHERGFDASAIGTILGAFAIAAAAVRFGMPVFAHRFAERTIITSALVAAAVAFLVYPFLSSPVAMATCSAAIGLTTGAVQPMVMSLLHQMTPPHRHGEVVAMRVLTINASSVVMPMLFGAASGIAGAGALFWVMAVAVGAGSRLGARLRDHEDHAP